MNEPGALEEHKCSSKGLSQRTQKKERKMRGKGRYEEEKKRREKGRRPYSRNEGLPSAHLT